MQDALEESINNKKIRVVIISAEGSTFSAGHDLKELTKCIESASSKPATINYEK